MESFNLPAVAVFDDNDAVASCVHDLLTRVVKQSLEKEENPGITGVVVDSTNGDGSCEVGESMAIDEKSLAGSIENEKGEEGPLLERSTSEDVDGQSGKDRMDMEKVAAEIVDNGSSTDGKAEGGSETPERNVSPKSASSNTSRSARSDEREKEGQSAVGRPNIGLSSNESAAGRTDSLKSDDYDNSSDDYSRRSDVNDENLQQNHVISNIDGVAQNGVENGGIDGRRRESDSKDDTSVSNSSESNAEEASPSTEREESQMRSRTESTPSDRTAGDPDGGYIFGSGRSDYENSSDEFDENEPTTSAAHAERINWREEERDENGGAGSESDDSEIMDQLIAHRRARVEEERLHRLVETPYHESPCRRLSFGSSSSEESVNVQNVGGLPVVDGADGERAENGIEPTPSGNVTVEAPVERIVVRRTRSDSQMIMERRNEVNVRPRKARSLIENIDSLPVVDGADGERRENGNEPTTSENIAVPVGRIVVRRVKSETQLSRMERRKDGVSPRKTRSLIKRSSISSEFEAELERKKRRLMPEADQGAGNLDMNEGEMPDIHEIDEVDDMDIDNDDEEAADDAVVDGNDDDDAASEATPIHTAIELRRSTRIRNPIDRWGYDHHVPRRRPRRAGAVQKRRRTRRPRRRAPQVPALPPPPPVPRHAPFAARMLPPLPPAPAPVAAIVGVIGTMDEIVEAVEEIEDALIQFDFANRQLDILLMLRRLQGQLAKFETTVPTDEQKKRMWNAVARIKAMMGSN